MKVVILTVILASTTVVTASAEDRVVLAELFTATWCHACPFADTAIDSLSQEMGAESLAVLQYHIADTLAIPECVTRAEWYVGQIIKLPSVWFDGVIYSDTTGSVSELYSIYRTHIEDRLTVSSPLLIRSQVSLGDTTGDVSTVVKVTEPFSEEALKLYFVLYESKLLGYNHVVRSMLPTEDLTISSPGDSVEVYRSFDVDSVWKKENMGIAVFVQSDTSKQVLQSERIDYPFTVVEESPANLQELSQTLHVLPNPFRRSVTIVLSLPQRLNLSAGIYDSSGRRIRTLFEGREDWNHSIFEWDGRDSWGRTVPSGVYFLQLGTSHQVLTRKIVCIR